MDEQRSANRLSLEVVYDDEHLIRVQCRVTVDGWSGIARAYTTREELSAFAAQAREFGETLRGPVAWEAGADNGVGLVGLQFYTIDRSKHIRCLVRLASEAPSQYRPEEIWRLNAELPTEAEQILRFARQLARIAEECQGKAVLSGV